MVLQYFTGCSFPIKLWNLSNWQNFEKNNNKVSWREPCYHAKIGRTPWALLLLAFHYNSKRCCLLRSDRTLSLAADVLFKVLFHVQILKTPMRELVEKIKWLCSSSSFCSGDNTEMCLLPCGPDLWLFFIKPVNAKEKREGGGRERGQRERYWIKNGSKTRQR